MNAIVVRCPNCNAQLKIASSLDVVECEYCHAQARVQRRTQVLERVLPPPKVGPALIATQAHSARWGVGGALVVVAIAAAIGILVVGRGCGIGPAAKRPTWQGTTALLVTDLDGDGKRELVGRARRVEAGDRIWIVALDLASGAVRWESDSLGSHSDTGAGMLAAGRDTIVFATPRGEVVFFDARASAPRWKVQLDERISHLCEGDKDTVVVVGVDRHLRTLARADGAMRPSDPARPCVRLASDVEARRGGGPAEASRLGQSIGLQVSEIHPAPGGRVLEATRQGGTRVPMLAFVDDAGTVRWKVDVPVDPLAASEGDPEKLAVGDRAVCAAYRPDQKLGDPHLTCFALADGKRLWNVAPGMYPLSSLAVTDVGVVFAAWGRVELRALDTGDVVWSYGEAF